MPQLSVSRCLRLAGVSLALFVVFGSLGCEDTLTGPRVLSATIDPDRIPKQDRGMSDEFFDIEMETSGFESDVQAVEFFVQTERGEQTNPEPQEEPTFETGRIVVNEIPKNWFADIDTVGTYPIGTEITSEQTEIRQRSITEVEVFDASNGG